MTFDLRALVRDVLRASEQPNPDWLVEAVLARVPEGEMAEALRQALPSIIREAAARERSANPIAPSSSMPTKAPGSWKVQAIREEWQRALRNRIHVGPGDYKFLGDCTYDDLLFAAAERTAIADKNAAIARSYNALAALLTEHDAKTVRDLPAEVLAPAIGRAA